MDFKGPVAVLHQGSAASAVNGIVKPMKPGGYRDSSADIAFALQRAGVPVVTPHTQPNPAQDSDWSFPDTVAGIEQAIAQGAQVLWVNTVLSASHPLTLLKDQGLLVVGQRPEIVEARDDKWTTNQMLLAAGCPIARATLIATHPQNGELTLGNLHENVLREKGLQFPLVVKPIRGRGSEGVVKVKTVRELHDAVQTLFAQQRYGIALIIEQFLPGEEITISVMPPGRYVFSAQERTYSRHWALPPVRRFNHQNGIAPYNGVVAVTQNSVLVDHEEQTQARYRAALEACEIAAELVEAVAPIRVDCRAASDGVFQLFDLNMKPNMTGAGRTGRDEQNSLTCIAARGIGWSYSDLLLNMLRQAWPL